MAFWSIFGSKPEPEERRSPSAADPITADHWISQRVEAMNAAGYVVDGINAMRQTAVYACVRILAETIASLPLYIYERGADDSKEPAKGHDLWPLLHDSPNNFQTAFEFTEMSIGHQCHVATSFRSLSGTGRGRSCA